MANRIRSRRNIWLGLALTAAVVVGAGLYWFQPWRLVTNRTVNESLPVVQSAQGSAPAVSAPTTRSPAALSSPRTDVTTRNDAPRPSTPTTSGTESPAAGRTPTPSPGSRPARTVASAARQLAAGSLLSHEHETTGTVRLVELADGRRVLTLENLRTSDGPDVHVWLAKAPVVPGEAGWYVFDDQDHVDLGQLKGNLGNQVYPVPSQIDPAAFPSVTLWCERFAVSFGAATLS